jgi:hypothetical protein
MIEKTENRYSGNAPATGSPARNRWDGKTSYTSGTLCAIKNWNLFKLKLMSNETFKERI